MPLADNQIKEEITRRWDESSSTYDTHAGHGVKSTEEQEAWKDVFKKALPEVTASVLDVGCGTGELSTLLAQMGYPVTGLDLSEKMLEKARAKAGGLSVKYDIGDAENPPYADGMFDAVFNRHVLWTLPNPEKALQGWKRVLKTGGQVMIVDGVWNDHTLNAKARRFASNVARLAVEGKNPWKDYYSKDLQAALPNMGGTPLEKAKGYLEMAGFKNVGHRDLLHIREIQRKSMPLRDRISHHFEYYLVYGNK